MRIIPGILSLLLLSACGTPALRAAAPQLMVQASLRRAVTTISVKEARDWLADAHASWMLLDLRTPAEYATGHLAGAGQLNFYDPDFRARLEGMDRNQPYILYCQSGNRSGQALAIMREMGFRNAYDIQGGIKAWQAAGYAVVTR